MPNSDTSLQIKNLLSVAKMVFDIRQSGQNHFITLNLRGIESLYVWHGAHKYEITLDGFDWNDVAGELNKAKSEIQKIG